MVRKLLIILIFVATVVALVRAQQSPKKNPCAQAQTQIEMNDCAAKESRAADQKLNKLYAELAAKLEPERLAKLKEAERAWIKFRDADCDFQSSLYKGGSIYPMIYNGCLTDNINHRLKQLEQMLKDENSR